MVRPGCRNDKAGLPDCSGSLGGGGCAYTACRPDSALESNTCILYILSF